mmetsp:Transcript_20508/g.62510  ORF Transcript_20508/g.62510 Transcript_20508/m.62510 type:complete len:209 (+) Transcript_20508:344-970(+)
MQMASSTLNQTMIQWQHRSGRVCLQLPQRLDGEGGDVVGAGHEDALEERGHDGVDALAEVLERVRLDLGGALGDGALVAREVEGDFAVRRGRRVRAVRGVDGAVHAEERAHGARLLEAGLFRVGGTLQRAPALDGALALEDELHARGAGHELDQLLVEGAALVLRVERAGQGRRELLRDALDHAEARGGDHAKDLVAVLVRGMGLDHG